MDNDVILKVENLSLDFRLRTDILHAVRDVCFELRKGRTLCLVGESGSGKSVTARTILRILDKNGDDHLGPHPAPQPRRQRDRHRAADRAQPGAAPHPRRPHRPHLPGADDLAVAGPHHRQPDRRGAAAPPAAWTSAQRARRRPISLLKQVEIAERRGDDRPLHLRVLGRHAPARDDRDGARLRPRHPDRRRADHRARRDHAGRDPRPHQAPAAEPRHGDAADHARHGRRRRSGRRRRGDALRPHRRGRAGRRHLPRRAASLHAAAPRLDSPAVGRAPRADPSRWHRAEP